MKRLLLALIALSGAMATLAQDSTEKEKADKAYNDKVKEYQLKEMELNLDLKRKQLNLPPAKPEPVKPSTQLKSKLYHD